MLVPLSHARTRAEMHAPTEARMQFYTKDKYFSRVGHSQPFICCLFILYIPSSRIFLFSVCLGVHGRFSTEPRRSVWCLDCCRLDYLPNIYARNISSSPKDFLLMFLLRSNCGRFSLWPLESGGFSFTEERNHTACRLKKRGGGRGNPSCLA